MSEETTPAAHPSANAEPSAAARVCHVAQPRYPSAYATGAGYGGYNAAGGFGGYDHNAGAFGGGYGHHVGGFGGYGHHPGAFGGLGFPLSPTLGPLNDAHALVASLCHAVELVGANMNGAGQLMHNVASFIEHATTSVSSLRSQPGETSEQRSTRVKRLRTLSWTFLFALACAAFRFVKADAAQRRLARRSTSTPRLSNQSAPRLSNADMEAIYCETAEKSKQ
jgi:hypothetical protein